jgi:streptogramin lyase
MRHLSFAGSLTAFTLVMNFTGLASAQARPHAAAAIVGTIRSMRDGPMEGVVVIAQRQGTGVQTAVTTDSSGQFKFPRDHVKPGSYIVAIRATGYEWPGSAKSKSIKVTGESAAKLDVTLAPINDISQLASQLTSLEWLNSFPGSLRQKDALYHNLVNCGFCHSLERIARSTHTAEEFRVVIQRMATYEPDHSSIERIQIASQPAPIEGLKWWWRDVKEIAEYLATVNLGRGKSTWGYALKVLPRPQGKATRAIVTVFPIPRPQSVVHDLDVDSKGNVWYGNTGWDFIGRLEPATGKFSEWPAPNFLPPAAPGVDRILGVQDIQVDPEDHVWAAVGGTKIAMFSPERAQWASFDVPVLWLSPFRAPVHRGQHAIWFTGVTPSNDGARHEAAFRLDIAAGKVGPAIPLFDGLPPPFDPGHSNPLHFCYMTDQDLDGNFICTNPGGSLLVRADHATGHVHVIPTITPAAFPRRGYRDDQNRFWFGEFYADKIGVIDLNTDTVKEYDTKSKYISPYYARPDKNGNIWVSSTGTDRLLRLDPKTGEITQYLMPVPYDARKVVVDMNAKNTTVWLPNKNAAQLVRVEVYD